MHLALITPAANRRKPKTRIQKENEMRHLKTAAIVTGAIGGALLMASQATADPITVDGIQFQSGASFQSSELYENTISSDTTLQGYGRIDAINSNLDYCTGGSDCELTFTFSGYTPTSITTNNVTFTGGQVMFYADSSADFNASDRATAANGDLFLATTGHSYTDQGSGLSGTLIATGSNLDTDQAQGNGVGYLDVTGGDAAQYFNTDTFDDFQGGTTDLQFSSTFSPNACNNTTDMPICGSGLVKGNAAAVPEPSALGLMGLGLVGVGFAFRRRRRK
jgi:hypothetical protein